MAGRMQWLYQFGDENTLAVVVGHLLVGDVGEQLLEGVSLIVRVEARWIHQANGELFTANK